MVLIFFKTEEDHFARPFHQSVEAFGLCVAAAQSRYSGYEIAIVVLLNQNRKFPIRFQCPTSVPQL